MDDRWDELAADLEGQAKARRQDEERLHEVELARAAAAETTLVERLRAAVGTDVVVAVRGAGVVRGTVAGAGTTWMTVLDGAREVIVLLRSVLSVSAAGDATLVSPVVPPASAVEQRWGIGHLLRRHALDRSPVNVVLDTGDLVGGTVELVAADHVVLTAPASRGSRGGTRTRRWVPFDAVATVSRELVR